MKAISIPIVLLPAMAVLFSSCKKDAEETHDDLVNAPVPNTVVAMSMTYTRAGATFDKSVPFVNGFGTLIRLDMIKFFISQPSFTNDDGDTVAAFDQKYLLVDLDEGGLVRNIGELSGHLHEIHFGLGIDSAMNNTDPVITAPPLNEPGMWWNWAAGFVFLAMEGKYDSDLSGDITASDYDFSYHCGMDELFTPVTIEVHTEADQGGNLILPFDLNIDSLLAGTNIAVTPVEQNVSPVSQGLMQQLAAGLSHAE